MTIYKKPGKEVMTVNKDLLNFKFTSQKDASFTRQIFLWWEATNEVVSPYKLGLSPYKHLRWKGISPEEKRIRNQVGSYYFASICTKMKTTWRTFHKFRLLFYWENFVEQVKVSVIFVITQLQPLIDMD